MRRLSIQVVVLTVIGSLVGLVPLQAENPYINIPEMQRLSREAWGAWWNSLTWHEQQIVRSVTLQEESYQRDTGNPYIPVNRNNLLVLMTKIGAQTQDANFVLNRMQVHAAARDLIDRVDRTLEYIHRNPNWYLPPNMQ